MEMIRSNNTENNNDLPSLVEESEGTMDDENENNEIETPLFEEENDNDEIENLASETEENSDNEIEVFNNMNNEMNDTSEEEDQKLTGMMTIEEMKKEKIEALAFIQMMQQCHNQMSFK